VDGQLGQPRKASSCFPHQKGQVHRAADGADFQREGSNEEKMDMERKRARVSVSARPGDAVYALPWLNADDRTPWSGPVPTVSGRVECLFTVMRGLVEARSKFAEWVVLLFGLSRALAFDG